MREWIATYAGEEYQSLCNSIGRLIDEATAPAPRRKSLDYSPLGRVEPKVPKRHAARSQLLGHGVARCSVRAPGVRLKGDFAHVSGWLFRNLDLTLVAGAWTCLLGPSGVGKDDDPSACSPGSTPEACLPAISPPTTGAG